MSNELTISHSEYVNAIDLRNSELSSNYSTLPTSYAGASPLTRYNINAGDGTTFPWLSGIANRFEKYQFTKLKFTYRPSCPTTTAGGLSLCAIYDPADDIPSDRASLFNSEQCVRAAVYDDIEMVCKPGKVNKPYYIRNRSQTVMDAAELRTTDPGFVVCAIVNTSSDIQFGDLFVEYEVKLIGPRVTEHQTKCALISMEVNDLHVPGAVFPPVSHNGNVNYKHPYEDHHHEYNTLSTRLISANAVTHTTSNGDLNPTRIVFEEPFCGILDLKTQSDTESKGCNWHVNGQVLGTTKDASDPTPWAQVKALHINTDMTDSDPSDGLVASYAIQAEAGDVIDLGMVQSNATDNAWIGKAWGFLVEASPYILDALELLFL